MVAQRVERTPEQDRAFVDLVREIKDLRPLPAVAVRMLTMSADDRFSALDLADTVRADQAMTLKVLRLANSAAFGLPRRITSIREAIVLLGFREVRGIALAVCLVDRQEASRIAESTLDYERFWLNSLTVAMFTQILAIAEDHDAEQAFTAGLVHNIGRLAVAQARPAWLEASVRQALATGASLHEAERRIFGFDDAMLGGAIVDSWTFPQRLVDAVKHHAMPLSWFDGPPDLDRIVARARRFARAWGVHDGLDEPGRLAPDTEWQVRRVANGLKKAGGVEGVLSRAEAFLRGSIDE